MSSIFLSHSSHDSAAATEIAEFVHGSGYSRPFLDCDPESGIAAGQDWEQVLYERLRSCQALIVLCSENSIASKWVFAEIIHARSLGKPLLPVKIDATELESLLLRVQAVDLSRNRELGKQQIDRWLRTVLGPVERVLPPHGRPYPGLLAFQKEDAPIFFGREREIAAALDRMRSLQKIGGARMLLVLGASGSGKSSLVCAGLLPRLERDDSSWIVVPPMRPQPRTVANTSPFRELAHALALCFAEHRSPRAPQQLQELLERVPEEDAAGMSPLDRLAEELRDATGRCTASVVVVIDQLEELLTAAEPREAARFWRLLRGILSDPTSPVMLLCTLRSDFLAAFHERSGARESDFAVFHVGPLEQHTWAQIIQGPAEIARLRLERGLVERMVHDTATPAALPLLAYTLRELWERHGKADGELTIDEYDRQLGGVAGCVARVFAEVLASARLSADELEELRHVFVSRLVSVNEQGQYVRRTARWSDLPPRTHGVLKRLEDVRLLVSGGENEERQVEVAHETLFRSSDILRRWLDEDREFMLWQKRLREAMRGWERTGQHHDALLPGVALQEAQRWTAARPADLEPAEATFIRKSEGAARARRRKRALSVVAAVAAVVAVPLLGFYAWRAYEAGRELRASAIVSAAANEPNPLLARLLLSELLGQPEPLGGLGVARRLVEEAVPLAELRTGHSILRATAAGGDGDRIIAVDEQGTATIWPTGLGEPSISLVTGHRQRIVSLAVSPDGALAVTGSEDGTARVWRSDGTGEPRVLAGHEAAVEAAIFSPDGRSVATAAGDGSVRLWRTSDGGAVRVLARGLAPAWSLAFSPDGNGLAAGFDDGSVRLWSFEGSPEPRVLAGHTSRVVSLEFSRDGARLLSAARDGTARLWNVAAVGSSVVLGEPGRTVFSAALSPDGLHVVTGSTDGAVRLWSATGGEAHMIGGHTGQVNSVAFSRDGQRVVSAAADSTARLWRVDGSEPAVVLQGHGGNVEHAEFSSGGARMLTVADDGIARAWRASQRPDPLWLRGHDGIVWSATFNGDGTQLVSSGEDGSLKLWSLGDDGGSSAASAVMGVPLMSAAISPDGSRVAAAAVDGNIHLCPLTLRNCTVLLRHRDEVSRVVFSPDGSRFAAAASDGVVQVGWSDGSREAVRLGQHDQWVSSIDFSPDGTRLLSGSGDGTARIWRVDGSGEPRVLRGHEGAVVGVAWARVGPHILTASDDGTVRVWRADADGDATPTAVLSHPRAVRRAGFSPDGTRVATAATDGGIRVWNADGRGYPVTLGRHRRDVESIRFNPDGTRVLTASADSTARLWPADGRGQPVILHVNGGVRSAAFNADGTRVVTASDDGGVRVWTVEWSHLLAQLRHSTRSCLTAEQRIRLLNESDAIAHSAAARCVEEFGRR